MINYFSSQQVDEMLYRETFVDNADQDKRLIELDIIECASCTNRWHVFGSFAHQQCLSDCGLRFGNAENHNAVAAFGHQWSEVKKAIDQNALLLSDPKSRGEAMAILSLLSERTASTKDAIQKAASASSIDQVKSFDAHQLHHTANVLFAKTPGRKIYSVQQARNQAYIVSILGKAGIPRCNPIAKAMLKSGLPSMHLLSPYRPAQIAQFGNVERRELIHLIETAKNGIEFDRDFDLIFGY